MRHRILVLDLGSQFTELLARRIREDRVYSEVHPPTVTPEWVREWAPSAIVISGGADLTPSRPTLDPAILELGIPLLAIGSGFDILVDAAGGRWGERVSSVPGEYDRAEIEVREDMGIFAGFEVGERLQVLMAEGAELEVLPEGYLPLAVSTTTGRVSAIGSIDRRIYGTRFHPEVVETPRGAELLSSFLFSIAGVEPDWTPSRFIEDAISAIRDQIGDGEAICGLSGGVDSAVAAALVHRAIGERLTCIFVDNGLMRKNEREGVEETFRRHLGIELVVVDASEQFFEVLRGVEDPEAKRKGIGETFIRVFEGAARELDGEPSFLVQGTLYPDVMESLASADGTAAIKSHHNVGGLPDDLSFELVEPLRELFKDEVREVGRELGLPEEMIGRHPFPGPGLAIRIMGEVTEERTAVLREVDALYLEEIRAAGLYDQIWQAFAVLLPIRSVGFSGDQRTYENVVALRAVTSRDGTTADWFAFPDDVLRRISTRIIKEVEGVNRVAYDVSSKPPATIEWE